MNCYSLLAISILLCPLIGSAQQRVDAAKFRSSPQTGGGESAGGKSAGAGQRSNSSSDTTPGKSIVSADYVIGPGDLLSISEADLEDTGVFADKSFRVDNSGDVNFPLAGRVHVAGLTTEAAEAAVNAKLGRVLKDPQAVIGLAEFHSQPVSVLGAVGNPGIMQIAGGKNLFEVLSLAGGLREDAGNVIKITRSIKSGPIPLPDATTDATGQFSVASVRVKAIMSASDPAQNIIIMPEDIITVPRAEVVYAVGALTHPGGFILGESGTLSTLQVISLSEGLLKTAAASRAEILRAVPGSSGRTQIAVNVKQLLTGKAQDVPLQPDDILFIPNSSAKSAGYRTIDAIVGATSGVPLIAARY
jgi:polysaccharide export outer membrane protein